MKVLQCLNLKKILDLNKALIIKSSALFFSLFGRSASGIRGLRLAFSVSVGCGCAGVEPMSRGSRAAPVPPSVLPVKRKGCSVFRGRRCPSLRWTTDIYRGGGRPLFFFFSCRFPLSGHCVVQVSGIMLSAGLHGWLWIVLARARQTANHA